MAKTAAWKQPFHQTRRWLAKKYLQFFPKLTVMAVTGSFGKTSTTRAIFTVLSQRYSTLMTDLNLDTVYNLPITILRLRPKHQKLVLELGVDHRGEMNSYLELVKPLMAVITGISPVHSKPELLGSLSGIIKEKRKLIEALPGHGYAILNYDDRQVRKMAKKTKARLVWYSLDKKSGSQVWAEKINVNKKGLSFTLHANLNGREKIGLKTGLVGRHFVYACLAAVAVGRLQGLSWLEIKRGLARLKPLKGRLSLEKGPMGSVLINDALRANPASAMAGLQTLADLKTKGKRVAVLGEMGELGRFAVISHQKLGQKVAELKIDCLISVGPLQEYTAKSAVKAGMKKKNVFWVKDVYEAAEILKKRLKKNDLFYLKGSLLRHLERVLLLLEGQKVNCQVNSCPFYHQCSACQYLKKGYNLKKTL